MVLEATVIWYCTTKQTSHHSLDNSDWMRNGDYTPTRMEAQQDAVNLLCGAKTQANPENTIAIATGAGKAYKHNTPNTLTSFGRPEVLVTLTTDLGKVLTALHGIKLGGSMDIISTLQMAQVNREPISFRLQAQLALKHRQNKNQQQRIIVFVGSPLKADKEELVRLGKRLKKNNVAVDIVNFGEEAENAEKLEAFISAVNSNDNRCICSLDSFLFIVSHLVTVPSGPHILSDLLLSSPIITGSSEGGEAPLVGSEFGGVDPNLDPELALVWCVQFSFNSGRHLNYLWKKKELDKKQKRNGKQNWQQLKQQNKNLLNRLHHLRSK